MTNLNKIITLALTFILAGGCMFNFLRRSANETEIDKVGAHLAGISVDQVDWLEKSDDYWKANLTPLQYRVTRGHATERAFSGRYAQSKAPGNYHCSTCGLPLFSSETKFESGTGWPSYFDVIDKNNLKLSEDRSFGMTRTEASCGRCHSHLGHVFNDGPPPTGLRYCINSISLLHENDLP